MKQGIFLPCISVCFRGKDFQASTHRVSFTAVALTQGCFLKTLFSHGSTRNYTEIFYKVRHFSSVYFCVLPWQISLGKYPSGQYHRYRTYSRVLFKNPV